MLEWLLKYEPALFARGQVVLDWGPQAVALGVLVAGVLVFGPLGYRAWRRASGAPGMASQARASLRRSSRGVWLGLVRWLLLVTLLLALLDPRLVVEVDQPVQGHVAVLIDDSRSMRIADRRSATAGAPAPTRGARALESFAPGRGALAGRLAERFDARFYAYGEDLRSIDSAEQLSFDAARSRLGQALDTLAGSAGGDQLAAVVLVGDGNTEPADLERLASVLERLRSQGVQVHVAGAGPPPGARDLEPEIGIDSVRLASRVLPADRVDAVVRLRHRGPVGDSVEVLFELDDLLVASRVVAVDRARDSTTFRERLTFDAAGATKLTVRLAGDHRDSVPQNDSLVATVRIRGTPLRVLHFEGQPRFEVKFLRRAAQDDPAIELTSLIRTAENKHYTLGARDSAVFRDGFPAEPEALFEFDVLVMGSVPRDLLTPAQLDAIHAFVERRGGGALFLGGKEALAEGGYAATPVARMLPVVLDGARRGAWQRVRVELAASSARDPLLDLLPGTDPRSYLEGMPELTVVNPLYTAKPGARVLLTGDDGRGGSLIVLAHQRYGRGAVAVFAVRDSWRWQMHAEVPLEDQGHERLWRQLLRFLGRAAPARLRISDPSAPVTPGQRLSVELETVDARYLPSNENVPSVRIVSPLGDVSTVSARPLLDRPGWFQADFEASETGAYEFEARLEQGDQVLAADTRWIDVVANGEEFRRTASGTALLEHIARTTGGSVLWDGAYDELLAGIDDAITTRRDARELPLADMPLLLLVIVALAGLEWLLRRRWSYA